MLFDTQLERLFKENSVIAIVGAKDKAGSPVEHVVMKFCRCTPCGKMFGACRPMLLCRICLKFLILSVFSERLKLVLNMLKKFWLCRGVRKFFGCSLVLAIKRRENSWRKKGLSWLKMRVLKQSISGFSVTDHVGKKFFLPALRALLPWTGRYCCGAKGFAAFACLF